MNTIKVYLLDDDEIQLFYLESLLTSFSNINIIGKQTDAAKGKLEIELLCPDLLFLDIDLITANGLELYRSLTHKPILILATSLLTYALDGFELDAVDYLVKPYHADRLAKAITKATTYFTNKKNAALTSAFSLGGDFMFIKDGTQLQKIFFNEVLYIEALGDFSEFYLSNGSKKIALVNLKNLELQLPAHLFIRVSRTNMVAIDKVTTIKTTSLMIDQLEINIGKSYNEIVINKIVAGQTIKRSVE
jgi:DNA-binding LytR/AlgR family response regulator